MRSVSTFDTNEYTLIVDDSTARPKRYNLRHQPVYSADIGKHTVSPDPANRLEDVIHGEV